MTKQVMVTKNKKLDRLISQYKKEGINRVKLAFADIDGVHRGKYISLEKFSSLAQATGGFCDCVLGWDVNDVLYENSIFTGWHTAFPDALFRIDLNSERKLKDENNLPLFLIDFVKSDTKSIHSICPRSLLQRVLKKAEVMGFNLNLSFEYEFFLFDETPHSLREKNYQNLKPLTPGNFGYSVIRNSVHSDLFNDFMDYCESLGIPLEGLHCETGPGVWEAAIQYTSGLESADRAAIFKTFSKVFFQKRNIISTFMAKWSEKYPGQSGHLHQSLIHKKSMKNLFYDKNDSNHMSALMKSYVAGLQKYLRPFLIMNAPTINSYTRLVKGAWAPITCTWGVENRTTALRVIKGSEKSQRVEFRLGAADGNPYLVAAANIGAGLLGIEEKLSLGKPMKGNAYEQEEGLPDKFKLPSNLSDAILDFKKSKAAVDLFGKEFVDHFIITREWEVREYEKAINDWQLKRYFEII